MYMPDKHKGNVLVTGATSGIGAAFAREYARAGYDLIITGRREEKINEFAKDLELKYRVNVKVHIIELSNSSQLDNFISFLKMHDIEIIINNAGFGIKNYYYDEKMSTHEDMVNVHVLCPMKIIHALLPNMLQKNKGTIINVSSEGAYTIAPTNSVYFGTKSFLKVFTESLYLDLIDTNIKVQVLCPGFTWTDFHEKMGMEKSKQVNNGIMRWMTPDEVVKLSLKSLEKGQVVCIPGLSTKLRVLMRKVMPSSAYYRFANNFMKKRQATTELQ